MIGRREEREEILGSHARDSRVMKNFNFFSQKHLIFYSIYD